jgi:hypothetical protein
VPRKKATNTAHLCPHDSIEAECPIDRENCYRRGYFQGADIVLREIEAGMSTEELRKWLNGRVYKWRNETRFAPINATIMHNAPPPEVKLVRQPMAKRMLLNRESKTIIKPAKT